MLKEIKQDITDGWKNYKTLHFKPRQNCTLKELEKKIVHTNWLCYSLFFWIIIMTTKLIDLFLMGKTSVLYLMVTIMLGIAIYDEQQNINNLRLFIYFKRKDPEIIKYEVYGNGRRKEVIY